MLPWSCLIESWISENIIDARQWWQLKSTNARIKCWAMLDCFKERPTQSLTVGENSHHQNQQSGWFSSFQPASRDFGRSRLPTFHLCTSLFWLKRWPLFCNTKLQWSLHSCQEWRAKTLAMDDGQRQRSGLLCSLRSTPAFLNGGDKATQSGTAAAFAFSLVV